MQEQASNLNLPPLNWPGLASCYFLLTLLGVYLTQQPGSLGWLPFGNGFAIGYALGRRIHYNRDALLWLLVCILAGTAARLLFEIKGTEALLSAICDGVQIVLAVHAARSLHFGQNIEHDPALLLRFVFYTCCLPPLPAAGLAIFLHDGPALKIWASWYGGACVATFSLLPLAIQMAQRHWRKFLDLNLMALCCVFAALTISTESWLDHSFTILLTALVGSAFLLPFVSVSILNAVVALSTCSMLAFGYLVPPPMTSYWQVLQLFLPLFLLQIPPLVLAASLRQSKMREMERLESERIAANATLEKMQLYETLLQQQQAQQENADIMQAILSNAADAIISTDQDGNIESFNRAAERIYGWQESQVLRKNLAALTHAKHGRAPALNAEGYMEMEHLRADGSVFPAELLVSQIQLGAQIKSINIVRDLSIRRRVEQLKADFVSTVSHELRTPLTSIRGALALINGGVVGAVPERMQKLIKLSLDNSERLTRLINDLLDIQKMEAGKMEFHCASHALAPLLQEAVEANLGYAQQYQVQIVLPPQIPELHLWVDNGRFIQILSNLLSNACKFSNPDQIVEIQLRQTGNGVQIGVIDHGKGISEEFVPHLFEKFSQSDSSDTKSKSGTGLGLAIARSIAQAMAGNLEYAPSAGGGCSFFLELPLSKENSA